MLRRRTSLLNRTPFTGLLHSRVHNVTNTIIFTTITLHRDWVYHVIRNVNNVQIYSKTSRWGENKKQTVKNKTNHTLRIKLGNKKIYNRKVNHFVAMPETYYILIKSNYQHIFQEIGVVGTLYDIFYYKFITYSTDDHQGVW